MEPPDHTRLRRLISTAFARGHVERLRPWVEELAGRLVDGLVERSGGPSRSTSCRDGRAAAGRRHRRTARGARGRPSAAAAVVQRDREDVRVRPHDGGRGRRRARRREFVAYLRDLAAERRRTRATTCLPPGQVRDTEGDRLTEDELVTTCILLLNAGHEATVNVSGNGRSPCSAPRPARTAARRPGAAADGDRGAHALRLPAAAVRAHGHRGRRDRRDHRRDRAGRSPRCSAPPTATPPSSPIRTPSTSAAPTIRTSPSAPASTSASAPRWPASNCRRRSARCSTGRRPWNSAGSRGADPSSSSAASPTCPSSSPADGYGTGRSTISRTLPRRRLRVGHEGGGMSEQDDGAVPEGPRGAPPAMAPAGAGVGGRRGRCSWSRSSWAWPSGPHRWEPSPGRPAPPRPRPPAAPRAHHPRPAPPPRPRRRRGPGGAGRPPRGGGDPDHAARVDLAPAWDQWLPAGKPYPGADPADDLSTCPKLSDRLGAALGRR